MCVCVSQDAVRPSKVRSPDLVPLQHEDQQGLDSFVDVVRLAAADARKLRFKHASPRPKPFPASRATCFLASTPFHCASSHNKPRQPPRAGQPGPKCAPSAAAVVAGRQPRLDRPRPVIVPTLLAQPTGQQKHKRRSLTHTRRPGTSSTEELDAGQGEFGAVRRARCG